MFFGKKRLLQKLKKTLQEDDISYVLITCSSPSKKGEMQAEMVYEGEVYLISYLVNNASQIMDEKAFSGKENPSE